MALRRPKTQVRSLTAAVTDIPLGPESRNFAIKAHEWQKEAWRLYDIVGELRFLANWIGDSVSQARLYVAELDENGEQGAETEDAEVAKLASGPLGTGDERDDNLRLTGIDLAVGGEAWFVVEGSLDEDTPDRWFVVTSSQVEQRGGNVIVRPSVMHSGGPTKEIKLDPSKDIMVRVWRPHPNAIDVADSPTRAAIPPLREIELLTKREFAELESRLTGAGVWPLPEGIDFPRGEDDPEGIGGFMRYMQRVMAQAMQDQSSASALVPHMFTVPDSMIEHIDKLRPITFWSELSEAVGPMKEKAIGRVAQSFDIPNEILTGMSGANHWTAWAISEEGIKRIRPYLAPIASALTRGWLAPALKKMGKDPNRFAYAFDTSTLAVRPNRQSDAMELFKEGLLAGEEVVKAGAFSVEQMPSDDETFRQLILEAVRSSPQLLVDPGFQSFVNDVLNRDFSNVGTVSRETPRQIEEEDTDTDEENDIPDTLDDGPPDGDEPSSDDVMSQLDNRLAQTAVIPPDYGTRAAIKLAVLRALELAGGRLVSPGDRKHRFAGTPRHELHTRIGGCTEARADKALQGAWEHVPVLAADLGMDSDRLRDKLHEYVQALITQGVGHDDDFLNDIIKGVRHG